MMSPTLIPKSVTLSCTYRVYRESRLIATGQCTCVRIQRITSAIRIRYMTRATVTAPCGAMPTIFLNSLLGFPSQLLFLFGNFRLEAFFVFVARLFGCAHG